MLTEVQKVLLNTNHWSIESEEPVVKIKHGDGSQASGYAVTLILRSLEAEMLADDFLTSHIHLGRSIDDILSFYSETGKDRVRRAYKEACIRDEYWKKKDIEYNKEKV